MNVFHTEYRAEELMPDFDRIRVLLHYDGKLHWEPGGIFRTTCDIDIAYFPFDTQQCLLLIGSYSYYSKKMNITNASQIVSTHEFKVNGEWHIRKTSALWNITKLGGETDGYSHVIFSLYLKRRFKFYIMNIVLPCIMLSVLIMIGFCLPPEAGEKISLGISVLLAFTVFLLMIADSIPRTSLAIPLIVTYLMTTMTLGTMSICVSVLILNIHHQSDDESSLPPIIRKIILIYLAKLLCVPTFLSSQSHETFLKESVSLDFNTTKIKSQNCEDLSEEAANLWKKRLSIARHEKFDKLISKNGKLSNDRVHSHIGEPQDYENIEKKKRFFSQKLCDKDKLKDVCKCCFNGGESSHQFPSKCVILKTSERRKRSISYSQNSDRYWPNERHDVARVLDRLFFWVLFFMMAASTAVILLYPKYTGRDEYDDD